MKIILTGGGTGGHFFPLISVARALKKQAEVERVAKLDLVFMSDDSFDRKLLLSEGIRFIKIPAGKMRRYFSLGYFSDTIKTLVGIIAAFAKLYVSVPDVIFSKGGYASFPVLFWARILKIPVMIHESDTIPGVVNSWSGKWAQRIAVSFSETLKYFENKNVALVGNPVRGQVIGGNLNESIEYFKLEENVPVVLILGGSQGSEKINETVLFFVKDALKNYQIIHQTGKNNFIDVLGRAKVILEKSENAHRYHCYPFLEEWELREAARAAFLVISRAGSGSIFEIAAWGLPSILIPLLGAAQDHQRENAYVYARTGACEVIEETNLTPHLLLSEIEKILSHRDKNSKMRLAASSFARLDAADKIAEEIIKLGTHE